MDENPAGNDEELSIEELGIAARIFRTLHILTVILHIGLTVALIYFGAVGYSWWIVIPLGSIAWFISLVLKRYFLNIAQSCQDDLEAHAAIADGDNITVTNPDDLAETGATGKTARSADFGLTVISLMVLVVSVWYLVGALIGLAIRVIS